MSDSEVLDQNDDWTYRFAAEVVRLRAELAKCPDGHLPWDKD